MGHDEKEKSENPDPSGGQAVPFVEFGLSDEIELLKGSDTYQRGFRSTTLAKYPDFSAVLIAIKAGARIKEHTAPGRISVLTLNGHIQMNIGEKLLDLPAGRLMILDPGIPHDVVALQDSAFLLTLVPPGKK